MCSFIYLPKLWHYNKSLRLCIWPRLSGRLSRIAVLPHQVKPKNSVASVHVWSLLYRGKKKSGEFSTYPSPITLATSPDVFGNISKDHSFILEPTFSQVVIFLLKSRLLAPKYYISLLDTSPLFSALWLSMYKLQHLDFSPPPTTLWCYCLSWWSFAWFLIERKREINQRGKKENDQSFYFPSQGERIDT